MRDPKLALRHQGPAADRSFMLVLGPVTMGWGGAGNDYVYAGTGNDFLFGGAGYDVLLGEDGNDWLNGGGAEGTADYLFGGSGADYAGTPHSTSPGRVYLFVSAPHEVVGGALNAPPT